MMGQFQTIHGTTIKISEKFVSTWRTIILKSGIFSNKTCIFCHFPRGQESLYHTSDFPLSLIPKAPSARAQLLFFYHSEPLPCCHTDLFLLRSYNIQGQIPLDLRRAFPKHYQLLTDRSSIPTPQVGQWDRNRRQTNFQHNKQNLFDNEVKDWKYWWLRWDRAIWINHVSGRALNERWLNRRKKKQFPLE